MGGKFGSEYSSLDIFGYLFVNSFLEQFYKTYQKGELLYSFFEDDNVSLLEESYLCFFKCLEYIVMDKILDKKGTMDPKDIRNVFNLYRFNSSQLAASGRI